MDDSHTRRTKEMSTFKGKKPKEKLVDLQNMAFLSETLPRKQQSSQRTNQGEATNKHQRYEQHQLNSPKPTSEPKYLLIDGQLYQQGEIDLPETLQKNPKENNKQSVTRPKTRYPSNYDELPHDSMLQSKLVPFGGMKPRNPLKENKQSTVSPKTKHPSNDDIPDDPMQQLRQAPFEKARRSYVKQEHIQAVISPESRHTSHYELLDD